AIEEIEDLESQLNLHAGSQRRGLDQCQIDRRQRRPLEAVALRVAARAGIAAKLGIDRVPRVAERVKPVIGDTAARTDVRIATGNEVWPAWILGASIAVGIARNDRAERNSAGVGPDHVDLPTAIDFVF